MKIISTNSFEEIILKLNLEPHIEGGYFKEHFRSEQIIPKSVSGKTDSRPFLTMCYYLLSSGDRSIFHKLSSDEIWSYHFGGSLHLFEIQEAGTLNRIILGPNLKDGEVLNHVVKKNTWIGALPDEKCEFSLVNATVYPGFEFDDWEKGNPETLKQLCPNSEDLIDLLT